MKGKWFAGLFAVFLCLSASFAQSTKNQNEIRWEYLEISSLERCRFDQIFKDCRSYNYLTAGASFKARVSLEWMTEAGWELVGVGTYDQGPSMLYFKRISDRERTKKEIEWLQKDFENAAPVPKVSDLIDLDEIETKQNLDEFNKNEEVKFRAVLEQIKDLPLKIISVSSKAKAAGRPSVGAEIVLDATSVLLKDGNKYRSSAADKYFQEAVKQILQTVGMVSQNSTIYSEARSISKGTFKPQKIGLFGFNTAGITLKISVIVNYDNQPNIVAQDIIYSSNLVVSSQ